MTTLLSYLVVGDAIGSPSNEWEARLSQNVGNNLNFLVYRTPIYDPVFIDVDYLDVQDASGTSDLKWYVGKNSVDSGNNFQIYFEQAPVSNVDIYGSAFVTANAIKLKAAEASITNEIYVTASAGRQSQFSGSIIGNADVSVSAGKQANGSASISIEAELVALGVLQGKNWTTVPSGSEVWNEI
jgi:hypothetical protein